MSIGGYNKAKEYQKAPKWSVWLLYVFLLVPIVQKQPPADQGQLPLLDGNSSRLLVPGHVVFKVSWQQLWLVIQWDLCYIPWQKYALFGD